MTETTLSPSVYQENLEFWQNAWNMVKTPYTQMPPLTYIPRIPAAIESKKSEPVLDLGCGSGWLSVYLCRNGFDVHGVDVAEHALELGRMWAEEEKLPIKFKCQDISCLNYPSSFFGSVVANSIFEHLTYSLAEETVHALHKVLQQNGLLVACFDWVGTGAGEFYELEDGTHVYTDKGRRGMMLRSFSDAEIRELFSAFNIHVLEPVSELTRILVAEKI